MLKNKAFWVVLVVVSILAGAYGSGLLTGTVEASTALAQDDSLVVRLASGTLQLQDTGNAITVDQVAELRTLWKTYAVLLEKDGAADEELEAVVSQIQVALTDAQLAAIDAMDVETAEMPGAIHETPNSSQDAPTASQSGGPMGGTGMGGGMGSDITQITSGQTQMMPGETTEDTGAGEMVTKLVAQVVEMLDELAAQA